MLAGTRRMFRNFLEKTDQVLVGATKQTPKYHFVFSFLLGGTSAFYLRDELNFPTYMRVKEALLTCNARQMQEPDVRVLRVIDPMTFVEARIRKTGDLVAKRKTYDDVIREQYLKGKQGDNDQSDTDSQVDPRSDELVKGLNLGAFDDKEVVSPDTQPKFVTEKSKIEYEMLMTQLEDNERILRQYQVKKENERKE